MCKTMCIVPCNFMIYKAIIEIFVIVLESWHFGFCTRFCLSLYELTPLDFLYVWWVCPYFILEYDGQASNMETRHQHFWDPTTT
jgi:hypothetical protein